MSTISIQSPSVARVTASLSSSPVRRTTLRLTTRGRRVLTTLAAAPLVAGIAFSVLAGGSALATGDHVSTTSFETVTVMPGDSLWSIAAEVAPNADPREVIDQIVSLNNLSGGMIQAGTSIAIPAQYSN